MRLSPGKIIDDRYEILSCIGEGGMSVVYEARQIDLDRVVAIKILSRTVAASEHERARLQREAVALSAIQSKNIVGFYGFGYWNGFPYIVMEYVTGRSLQSILQGSEPISVERTLHIAKQIAHALVTAHAHGIIHRDLKPSNIMLVEQDGAELVKIIDFGLAFLLPTFGTDQQKLTDVGFAVGSALYMSPEQCLGNVVDERADIYSVGTLLHHCLTGNPPFLAQEVVAVMFAQVNTAPPPLEQAGAHQSWPSGLQALPYKCMAKSPDDRYSTAAELLADLENVQHGRACQGKTQFLTPGRPRLRSLPVAVLGIVSLMGIVVLSMWLVFLKQRSVIPVSGPQAYEIYRQARDIPTSRGRSTEQRELLEKALALNERDRSLRGFALADAQGLLYSDYSQTRCRAKAQEIGYKLVRNPWFDNMPDYTKARIYDLYGSSYRTSMPGEGPDCEGYEQKRAVIFDKVRQDLTKMERDGTQQDDLSNMMLQVARLSNDPAKLEALIAEARSKLTSPKDKANFLIGMAECYSRSTFPNRLKRARELCDAAEQAISGIRGYVAPISGRLQTTYFSLGDFKHCYERALGDCNASNITPIALCQSLIYVVMSLEVLGRHGEEKPFLDELKVAFHSLTPSEAEATREEMSTYSKLLKDRNRLSEARWLKETFDLPEG